MRLHAAAVMLALSLPYGVSAAPKPAAHAETRPGAPPHAWLFGVWTGGLFPVLNGMTAQDCRSEEVIQHLYATYTHDHAALTASGMTQRLIETVRTSATGAEFRLTPSDTDPAGFGCDGPDVLHVARESNNTVSFPNCAAFPYPLERCPTPGR